MENIPQNPEHNLPAMSEQQVPGGSKKKLVIVTVIMLAILFGGYFVWAEYGSQAIDLFEDMSNKIFCSLRLQTDCNWYNTTNWQTYRNEEYGFEVKYPGDWGIQQINVLDLSGAGNNDAAFVIKSAHRGSFSNLGIYPRGTGGEIVEEVKSDVIEIIAFATRTYFRKLSYDNGGEHETYSVVEPIPSNWIRCSRDQLVGCGSIEVEVADEVDRNVLQQILSTFKFLEPDTSSWQTYRNEEYKFEFKYPNDWRVNPSYSELGGFFYIPIFNPNEKAGVSPVGIKIYPNQITLDKFTDLFSYLKGNWDDTIIGGNVGKETLAVLEDRNYDPFFVAIVVKNNYGYELEAKDFIGGKSEIELAKKILSTFKFTR